jgi:hypothetical protein
VTKLISEKTVQKAFATGKMQIFAEPGSIVTPQAESVAEHLGVKIIKSSRPNISYSDKQKIIDEVLQRFPGGKFSRAKIEKAVQEVLNVPS